MFLAKRIASALLLLASFGLAVRPPTVLLHLSDIHLSTNVQKYWRAFGDREGDLELFAGKLLAQLAPQGVLLSGDLTDSKDAAGAGLQQEAEWQAYRRILDAFVAAGVPESLIFDLRGNHDVFNMALRGGPNDFCRTYSAEGRRCPVSQRVFSAVLPAPRQPQHAGPADAAGTVNSRRLAESLGSGGQADSETQEERCPQVAILGVDPTPEPGLRSPANFGGVASKALLDALKAELQGLRKSPPQGCPPPLVVSQGHYPLSTMDAPTQVTGPLSLLRHLSRSAQSMQLVAQVLAEHNVSAYLAGHLHGAFGQRLHRLHATPAGGYLAELETAAWKDDRRFRLVALDRGALTFADLFFHAPGTPRRPRRKEDGLAVKENAWLEAYQQRGYAVTPADPSAKVLHHIALITWPPDARYSPLAPSNPQQQQGQQAQQASASREAGRRLADGTGGATEEPVGAGSSSSNSSRALHGATSEAQEGDVRAMVFSLDPRAAAHPEQWQVTLHTWLPGGAAFSPPLRMLLQPAGGDLAGGPQLFSASLAVDLNCSSASSSSGSRLKAWWEGGSSAAGKEAEGGCAPPADHIFAQVEVRGGDGHVSSSPTQPTALHCRPLPLTAGQGGALSAHRMQRCVAAVPPAPLPLGTSWLERLILAVNWPVVVHRLFIFLWVCHVGLLLLLPRMLCSRWAPRISASPLFRPQSTALLSTTAAAPAVPTVAPPTSRTPSQWQPVGQSATGRAAAASLKAAKRWAAAAPQALGGFLLWPAAALVLLPCEMGTWMALVAYMCYLLVGPWYVAELLSGYPRAVLFHAGVLAKLPAVAESGSGGSSPASSWRFIGTSDVFVMSLVHLMFCVFPMTLWVACVVGRRQLALKQSLPDRPSRRSSSSTVRVGIDGSSSSSDSSASAPVTKECGSSQGGVGLWVKLQQFTVLQLLALAGVAALNVVGAYDKAAKMNGWMSVVLSPGFAWTIPLAVLPVLWPPLSKQALCLGKGD